MTSDILHLFSHCSRVLSNDAYPFKVHTLHCLIHPFNHAPHTVGNRSHGYGRLYSTGNSIDPGRESQKVEPLILFADGVLGINPGTVGVAFGQGLCLCQHGKNIIGEMHTCFSLFFSEASSLVAFLACLWRDFAVNWAGKSASVSIDAGYAL